MVGDIYTARLYHMHGEVTGKAAYGFAVLLFCSFASSPSTVLIVSTGVGLEPLLGCNSGGG